MLKIPAWLRTALLSLMILGVTTPALAACDSDQPTVQESIAPTAYIDPTTGQPCAPWVNNPNEPRVMGMTEPACRLPIPTDPPVREPGMSDADWFLLGGLFGFGMGHHNLYWGPNYYTMAIGPAWDRYPGSYRGYGGRPIVHVDNRTYNNTVIKNVNVKYAAQEKTAERDPKLSGYKDVKTGKTYTGATVPPKAFSGTNAPTKAGGNANTTSGITGKGGYSPTSPSSGKGGYSPPSNSGSSGKGGYSPSNSGSSGRSGGYSPSPSSGSGRSSGGGGRR